MEAVGFLCVRVTGSEREHRMERKNGALRGIAMKQLSAVKTAYLFAGCFLGAGFVSGQELWQFFGCFGKRGFLGLGIAAVLFALCGILLIRLAQISGVRELDETVIRWNIPWLRGLMAFLQCVCLFGVVAIMIAGGGALIHQLWPAIPAWSASLVMSVLVALVAVHGLSGVAAAFSVCVPLIVLVTVGFCAGAFHAFGTGPLFHIPAGQSENVMLPAWPLAAVTYVAYNTFGSIGILTPFGERISGRKRVYRGVLLGTALLILIAVSVLLSLFLYLPATEAEMPMLEVACRLNRGLGYLYGLLLLAGIYGTALSCSVAVGTFLQLRRKSLRRHGKALFSGVLAAAFLASLAGFGDLISTVYPVFGYLGALSLLLVFWNWLYYRNKEKNREKGLDEGV